MPTASTPEGPAVKLSPEVQEVLDCIVTNSGGLLDKLRQINGQVREPSQLASIRRRSTFKAEYQQQWDQMQLLFLLACFYHRNEMATLKNDSVQVIMAKLAGPLQEIA